MQMHKGYSNLSSHITMDHRNWRDEFKRFQKQSSMDISFTSQKGHDIYRWLEWIVMGHHPLNFCENILTRKNSTLSTISADTLVSYLEKITGAVEQTWTGPQILLITMLFSPPIMLKKNKNSQNSASGTIPNIPNAKKIPRNGNNHTE